MAYLDSDGVTTLTQAYDKRYKAVGAAESATNLDGTVPVENGGTGRNELTSNAVITGNGTNSVNMVGTQSGALYATATGGAASFGTLPIAQGGTGATSAANALTNLGAQAAITSGPLVNILSGNGFNPLKVLISDAYGKIVASSISRDDLMVGGAEVLSDGSISMLTITDNVLYVPNDKVEQEYISADDSTSTDYNHVYRLLLNPDYSSSKTVKNNVLMVDTLRYNPYTKTLYANNVVSTTQSPSDNSTKVATTAFVANKVANMLSSYATTSYVDSALTGAAMYQGAVTSGSAIENLADYKKGWYWIVKTGGTYCGAECEVGDMIFCNSDRDSSYSASDFDIIQSNITAMTTTEINNAVAEANS